MKPEKAIPAGKELHKKRLESVWFSERNQYSAGESTGTDSAPLMEVPESDEVLTRERSLLIDDAARLLGVSRRTVYYRIREGRLRTIRTRCGSQRVLLSTIESLLREIRKASVEAESESESLALEVQPLP